MTFEPDYSAPPSATPSWWRRSWDRVRAWRPGRSTSAPSSGGRTVWRWTWRIVLALLILYYPVGALVTEDIDDDPQFTARGVAPGESNAVATAADLGTLEGDVHTRTPMTPFFTPAGLPYNMPNLLPRILSALGRFSTAPMDR